MCTYECDLFNATPQARDMSRYARQTHEDRVLHPQRVDALRLGGVELSRAREGQQRARVEAARRRAADRDGREPRRHARLQPDVARFLADVARCEPDIAAPWLQAVFAGRPLDEVCQQRGISVIELLSELAVLELNGQVVRLPGQRYAAGNHDRNRSCTP